MDKSKKRIVGIGLIAAIGVLAILVSVAALTVTTSISYQGKLTDSAGNPLSGTYDMTFSLYDVASGGTVLDTDSQAVDVTDGLFNTNIDFSQGYFDGRDLWLGLKVESDPEMTPRQEFKPVPYALSLKPGAVINGSVSGPVLDVNNDLSYGGGIRIGTMGDYSRGVRACTTGYQSDGVSVYTTGDNSNGVSAYTTGGMSNGVSAHTTGDYSDGVWATTTGNNSDGIRAYSAKGYGVYGEGKYGGYFTTNQAGTGWSDKTAGVNATTAYDYSAGVQAHTSGDYSTGVDAVTSGDHSLGVQASTTGENSPGVDAYTTGDSSDGVSASAWGENSVGVRAYSVKDYGVYGKGKSGGYFTTNQGGAEGNPNAGVNVTTIHDYCDGGRISTSGDRSYGISTTTSGYISPGVRVYTSGYNSYGVSAATSGDNSNGVHAYTSGADSEGVSAYTTGYGSYGVSATTTGDHSDGVDVSTSGDGSDGVDVSTSGIGSYGVDVSTSGIGSYGVRVSTTGDGSEGVFVLTSGNDTEGVHVLTYDNHSVGVETSTFGNGSEGVFALTTGESSDGISAYTYGNCSHGVWASSTGGHSHGVCAYSAKRYGIYAYTGHFDHRYGVYTPDYMYAAKYEGGGSDVAEYFPVAEEPELGTVMVIGEDSKLQSSTTAYDTTVAGIVSTAPGVALGTNETGNEGEELIAVAGRVPCKVDASYTPIEPGDLLTTSDTPGHAMKATDSQIGTILGKALEPLDSGTGVIEVLVTLQ